MCICPAFISVQSTICVTYPAGPSILFHGPAFGDGGVYEDEYRKCWGKVASEDGLGHG